MINELSKKIFHLYMLYYDAIINHNVSEYVCLLFCLLICIHMDRDRPIMLIFLPIMLCCSAQIFDLLCSYYAHVKDLCLGIWTVLLEYIHLYHKIFNMVTVLLEYI